MISLNPNNNQTMSTEKILKGFNFATSDDRLIAEQALWVDLPSVILITGPAGSGKTTLALRICQENQLQNAVCIGRQDLRGYQIIRRSGRPVIIDNFKPARIGSSADQELCAFLSDPTYWERKLGTTACRKIGITNSLVIFTSSADEISQDLWRRIDLLIQLSARPETFSNKRRASSVKKEGSK